VTIPIRLDDSHQRNPFTDNFLEAARVVGYRVRVNFNPRWAQT
jgi:hypothetical protein